MFAAPGQPGPVYNAGVGGDRETTLPGDAADIAIRISAGVVGDYSKDQFVDGADLLAWQRTLSSTTQVAADGNGNALLMGPT